VATERDSEEVFELGPQELNPGERAIAKTALKHISTYETAALLGRSQGYVSKERGNLVQDDMLEKEGSTVDAEYHSRKGNLNEELTLEEVLHKNAGVIQGTLFEELTSNEIGQREGLTPSAISSRRNTLQKNGVLTSEGMSRAKEYYPGIRLVERLNRKDKINHGQATPFHWNPNETRVFWNSEANDAETLHELNMLDRLAYRIDQAMDSDDYRMPDLDHLDPFKDRDRETLEMNRDDVFSLLNSPRRRHVMRYLLDIQPSSTEAGELSENIAAMENDKAIHQINSE